MTENIDKSRKREVKAHNAENSPTKERRQKADLEEYYPRNSQHLTFRSNGLRIDKLKNAGIINEWQHNYALQWFTYFTIKEQANVKSTLATMEARGLGVAREDVLINKLSCADKFNWIVRHMNRGCYDYLRLVVIAESSVLEAARACGIERDLATSFLRSCLDDLGDIIQKMREREDELQKALDLRSDYATIC